MSNISEVAATRIEEGTGSVATSIMRSFAELFFSSSLYSSSYFPELTTHRLSSSYYYHHDENFSSTESQDLSNSHHNDSFMNNDHNIMGMEFFSYEKEIAFMAAFFFRYTVAGSALTQEMQGEKFISALLIHLFFSLAFGFLAYVKEPLVVQICFLVFSYQMPKIFFGLSLACRNQDENNESHESTKEEKSEHQQQKPFLQNIHSALFKNQDTSVITCLVTSLVACTLSTAILFQVLSFFHLHKELTFSLIQKFTPRKMIETLHYLFPIEEISNAYETIIKFSSYPKEVNQQISYVLYITTLVQFGMGYIGIDFLRSEQVRKNKLVKLDSITDSDMMKKEDDSDSKNNNNIDNETKRKNIMKKRAKQFQGNVLPFILYAVLPYMIKIIVMGNINEYVICCFRDEMHRAVRLIELFDHESYLVALSSSNKDGKFTIGTSTNSSSTEGGESVKNTVSPAIYASSMVEVVSTSYDLLNRKMFSVPKLLLLPQILVKEPLLVLKLSPFIMLSDYVKGKFVSSLSATIEQKKKEAKDLVAKRNKIEEFDLKHSDLLMRSGVGSLKFTQKTWSQITEQIQTLELHQKLLKRTRGYFGWLQRNFIFVSLIDCALANLIAFGRMFTADLFVFTRAIEDVVDLILMKSRAEAELSSMRTELNRLDELAELWQISREQRALLSCTIVNSSNPELDNEEDSSFLRIQNLEYSRGKSAVRVNDLSLKSGIYAVTGPNGSGKSTLFRILMACDSNDKPTELHRSIFIKSSTSSISESNSDPAQEQSEEISAMSISNDGQQIPEQQHAPSSSNTASTSQARGPALSISSSHMVEISQTFYWPLFTKPIEWIYQTHGTESAISDEQVNKVVKELQDLIFISSSSGNSEKSIDSDKNDEAVAVASNNSWDELKSELLEEKEDWFSSLSGGQKSKVELVRKVFLSDTCPEILLIDESKYSPYEKENFFIYYFLH